MYPNFHFLYVSGDVIRFLDNYNFFPFFWKEFFFLFLDKYLSISSLLCAHFLSFIGIPLVSRTWCIWSSNYLTKKSWKLFSSELSMNHLVLTFVWFLAMRWRHLLQSISNSFLHVNFGEWTKYGLLVEVAASCYLFISLLWTVLFCSNFGILLLFLGGVGGGDGKER